MATMVSSRCMEPIIHHDGSEDTERRGLAGALVPQVRVLPLDANLGSRYFAGTVSPTRLATLNVSLPSRLSASTTM
jgi:hypothetical protein